MNEILQQIGALLLGAIPTILLFVVLVAAYQFLVQGPLNKTLESPPREDRGRHRGCT